MSNNQDRGNIVEAMQAWKTKALWGTCDDFWADVAIRRPFPLSTGDLSFSQVRESGYVGGGCDCALIVSKSNIMCSLYFLSDMIKSTWYVCECGLCK